MIEILLGMCFNYNILLMSVPEPLSCYDDYNSSYEGYNYAPNFWIGGLK
jgi:hypothetical protein